MTSLRSLPAARIAVAIGMLFVLDSFGGSVRAESPTINSMTPQGVQRGSEVEVKIGGQNLADDPQLILYYPGIEVKSVEPSKDRNGQPLSNSIVATLKVAPDCRPGTHALRVRTASGLTPMPVLFSVGVLSQVPEIEPNNTFEAAQSITNDTTIEGVVLAEDVDTFVLEAKKGQRISVEVEAMRLARTIFDPLVIVFDENKNELARSDDEAFGWYDAVVSLAAPRDGKYFIQLRETTFGGSGSSLYRLHVGSFPRPTAVIPAGGRPGETLEVTFLGDATGSWKRTITVPMKPEFYSTFKPGDRKGTPLFAENEQGTSPTPLIFRVNDLDNVVESEPNDDPTTQANPGTAPIAFNGVIQKPGDVDCFEFTATKGQVYDIRVHARSIRSPLDSVLTVYRKSTGAVVGTNDDSGSPDSYYRLTCNDETYVVAVKDMLGEGGVNYAYRVEVTPVQPTVELSIAEKVLYIDTIAAVPQGNRAAVMLNAARKDYNGEVVLDVAGLPKGMKYETAPLAPGQTSVPFMLIADAKAAPAAGVLDVTVRSPDKEYANLAGRLAQHSQLLRGNNRPVFEHTIERLTSAITKPAPFSLEVVQPKVPLVRNGTMDLVVKVRREPGFTAPINIRMLYNPAGTASAAAAKIEEGKSEGTLFVNASSTAELREWKVVVLGVAPFGTGNIEVASQFINLQVGEPYFDLAFTPASVEQGKELRYVVGVTNNVEFEGKAKLSLLGLPTGATAEPIEISKDATEAAFTVKTTDSTLVGRHKSVMCNLVVVQNGEPINHTFGPGEIRVDAPPKQVALNATAPRGAASNGKPGSAGSTGGKPTVSNSNNQ